MRDIPVMLDGYKLTVVEEPATKTRDDGKGNQVTVIDREGVTQFVVSLFAKRIASRAGERVGKGEEIKVTLETDPGEGFAEDTRVELINPRLNFYEIEGRDGRPPSSGISFKAAGLTPVRPRGASGAER